LIPCAFVRAWILNVLRISAIALIGNAGYGEIAMLVLFTGPMSGTKELSFVTFRKSRGKA
jgi:hypothetical protein